MFLQSLVLLHLTKFVPTAPGRAGRAAASLFDVICDGKRFHFLPPHSGKCKVNMKQHLDSHDGSVWDIKTVENVLNAELEDGTMKPWEMFKKEEKIRVWNVQICPNHFLKASFIEALTLKLRFEKVLKIVCLSLNRLLYSFSWKKGIFNLYFSNIY